MNAITESDPKAFREAMVGPQSEKWMGAIGAEISALQADETWELMKRIKGTKALHCKWVVKIKLNGDGSVERYKAV